MGHWKSLFLFLGLASAAAVVPRADPELKYPQYSLLADCPGYKAVHVKESKHGVKALLKLNGKPCNAYGEDLKELTLDVTYETDERIHVKIQDKGNSMFQIPESVFPRPDAKESKAKNNAFKFEYTEDPFSFKIRRRSNNDVLFDTSAASLIFESQYLRLRTRLPEDPYLYGLGEHSDPFRLKHDDYIRTMWTQDSYGIPEDSNLYGVQPFYLEHRVSGSHGVFLLNANGMDVMIRSDDEGQYLEYNILGGVLDFYFFAGPTPTDVTKQYAEVAGLPTFQPYWGLGFHQCRYGYRDAFDVAEVVYNYSQAGIPLETMWTDIDYMDRRLIFTTDPERYPIEKLRSLVSHLHENKQHYIVMVDPAAGYQENYPPLERGIENNIWLLRQNGSFFLGVVWPGVTVFPDWFADKITDYWNHEFELFFSPDDGVDIDGLWIDMNEPSSFACTFPCDNPYEQAEGFPPKPPPVRENPRSLPGWPCEFQLPEDGGCDESLEQRDLSSRPGPVISRDVTHHGLYHPQGRSPKEGDQTGLPGRDLLYPEYSIHNRAAYRPDWNADKGGLSNKTVLTNVIHQNGVAHYDAHNLYGHMMGMASYDAMLNRRPDKRPLIITRSTFAGTGRKVGHWLGDNMSNWDHYRASIRTALVYSSLFQFPMVGSDVCGFGGNTTEELCARWASLGAFSTFYRNHNELSGESQEFYRWESVTTSARKAIEIRYRLLDYMYTAFAKASSDGEPSQYPVFYLYPEDKATWDLELQYFYGPGLLVAPVTEKGATSVDVYLPKDTFYDWYTHEPICGEGKNHTFSDVDVTHIPLLIRSGVILPLRESSANTTAELREKDFEILIPVDDKGEAKGELYFDDGESIDPASNGGVTRINLSYKKGILTIHGEFGYNVGVGVSKITVLDAGKSCKGGRRKGAESGRTRKVKVSLNEPSKTRV
ncbi:alpha/beta-glucosidase-like protein [Hapsidospora chrysogenum ATCC 11550]|uniref:Probable alpha/beta-glucosidase agdC n=1 Tax=Hapsidospora chrysogenum (strain ATCC 11550 / CBS 779.69 / DSM 880 / IAM 14645 / JCM 23072 / IMI 49137) TaxID=857340 RepID=A0A086SWM6_HAPC1|nr:alpha/beta-glucosidase-like protein [Hapsidospora chrysogenum ATCC 11550]